MSSIQIVNLQFTKHLNKGPFEYWMLRCPLFKWSHYYASRFILYKRGRKYLSLKVNLSMGAFKHSLKSKCMSTLELQSMDHPPITIVVVVVVVRIVHTSEFRFMDTPMDG